MKHERVRGYGTYKNSVSLKDTLIVLGLCFACIGVIAATLYVSGTRRENGGDEIQISTESKKTSAPENVDTEKSEDDKGADVKISNSAANVLEKPPEIQQEETAPVNEDEIYGTESVVQAASAAVNLAAPLRGTVLKGQSSTELMYSKTLEDWRLHNGIDIAADVGATVCSAADGVVEDAFKDVRFGYTIVISHGENLKTVYSNLTGTKMVKIGKDIAKGDPIGMVGESAICESLDESHLHFEVILDGEYVNPLDYFSL